MSTRVLTDKDRLSLNKDLQDLLEHETEIKKAVDAKVPKADETLSICHECQDRIKALKETYFPGKR